MKRAVLNILSYSLSGVSFWLSTHGLWQFGMAAAGAALVLATLVLNSYRHGR